METKPETLRPYVEAVEADAWAVRRRYADGTVETLAQYADRSHADGLLALLEIVGAGHFLPLDGDPDIVAVRILDEIVEGGVGRYAWQILETVDRLLGGFGVEAVEAYGGRTLLYSNAGDSYAGTVAVVVEGSDPSGDWARPIADGFVVASWADFVEAVEAEAYETDGVRPCPYCGEMRDPDGEPCGVEACPVGDDFEE
jgi:hypothetical protein